MADYSREQIAEILANKSLTSGSFNETLSKYQQVLRSGSLFTEPLSGEKILTFKDDFLSLRGIDSTDYQNLIDHLDTVDSSYWGGEAEAGWPTGNYSPMDPPLEDPPNVSQFINFESGSISIDSTKLNEVLDTNIFELIPGDITRQDQINQFFELYFRLRSPNTPPYCQDADSGAITIDIDGSCEGNDGYTYEMWRQDNDISYPDGIIDDDYITRLNVEATGVNVIDGIEGSEEGVFQTLQWIYGDLQRFLLDKLNDIPGGVLDSRPGYTNKSEGYLEIRNLNQSIIIKKGEGINVGIGKSIQLFDVEGADYWTDTLGYDFTTYISGIEIPSYLIDGFTITMWVKFLDKVNTGTLFNYGNPVRNWEPHGFTLETFVMDQESNPGFTGLGSDLYGENFFQNNNQERFVRLIVREGDNSIRDSHFGTSWSNRVDTSIADSELYNQGSATPMFNYTRVPIDFEEWYFIVASYNPLNDEALASTDSYDYWQGNGADGSVHYSGFGSKCKVEILSKSDLLRARGYRPENGE